MEDSEWFAGESQLYSPPSSPPVSESDSDPEFDPSKIDPTQIDFPEYRNKCVVCSGLNRFEYYMCNSNPNCLKYFHWVCSFCDRRMKSEYRCDKPTDSIYPPCPLCKTVEESEPHQIKPSWALPGTRELRYKRREQREKNRELEEKLKSLPTPLPKTVKQNCTRAARRRIKGDNPNPNPLSQQLTALPLYYEQGELPVQGHNPESILFVNNKKSQGRRRVVGERSRFPAAITGHRLGDGNENRIQVPPNEVNNVQSVLSYLLPVRLCSFNPIPPEGWDYHAPAIMRYVNSMAGNRNDHESSNPSSDSTKDSSSSSDEDYDNLFTLIPRKTKNQKASVPRSSSSIESCVQDSQEAGPSSMNMITENADRDKESSSINVTMLPSVETPLALVESTTTNQQELDELPIVEESAADDSQDLLTIFSTPNLTSITITNQEPVPSNLSVIDLPVRKCEFCDLFFQTKRQIYAHKIKFHKEKCKVYKCGKCFKTFARSDNLKRHSDMGICLNKKKRVKLQ